MAATLKDVAARAGVSIKTVSNVVNDHPQVAAETRARVRRAIDALGYHPNLSARHLRHPHAGVIALAIPDLGNTYFSDIGYAVAEAAASYGYTVLTEHTDGGRDAEMLVAKGLRPHLIDGVILSPFSLCMDDLRPAHPAQDDLPIVLLGEYLIGAPRDHVMIDNVVAARLATGHLLSLGRRRLAAIGVQEMDYAETTRLRLRGFMEALAEAGLDVDPRLLVPASRLHRRDGGEGMRYLLSLDEPPDAVFCFNDLLALGAIRALHEEGLRVPDDVAVVGFDDIEEGSFATPSLTTVSPDKAAIGRLAVSALVGRIQGTRMGPPERIEPSFTLVIRESTAGPNPCHRAYGASVRREPIADMMKGGERIGIGADSYTVR